MKGGTKGSYNDSRRNRTTKRPIDKKTFGANTTASADTSYGVPFDVDDVPGSGAFFWEAPYPCTLTGIRWTGEVIAVRDTSVAEQLQPEHGFMIFFVLKEGMDAQNVWTRATDNTSFYTETGFRNAEMVIGWQSFNYNGTLGTVPGSVTVQHECKMFDGTSEEMWETERYSKSQRKLMTGDQVCWQGIIPQSTGATGTNLYWKGAIQIFVKS